MIDLEMYFIGLLFCKNRDLLKKENRDLYDTLFERYKKVAKKQHKFDLELLNAQFYDSL
jgi:hypothetical protein